MEADTAAESGKLRRAREIVGWYTLGAIGTGAVPVPATSLAIVANNGFMLAHVGATMGTIVNWEGVVCSLGIAGSLNIAGRAVFVEAGKALSWGTGNLWALAALSAVGAGTAGLQTYILGLIAIEMSQNGGQPIDSAQVARVIAMARETLPSFVAEMKEAKPSDPGVPSVEAQARVESALPLSDNTSGTSSALGDAGAAIRGVVAGAADTIGTRANSANSAIRGAAAGAAGAVGSVFQRRQDATGSTIAPASETVDDGPESPDA